MDFKRFLAEPLLHFVLLGAAIFAAFSFVGGEDEGLRDDRIVVPAGKIEHLAALFNRTWQRPPTRTELDGLIDDYIREEAAYREGLAMGLDRDDTVIRRRIRQKLDFVAEDLVAQVEPTEADLESYLEAHPDDFRIDARLSFRHVYFSPQQRGDSLAANVRDTLTLLNGDPTVEVSALGDRILLEPAYADVSVREIGSLMGAAFAAALAELEPGAWHGPIESGYGMHAVIIDRRTDGRVPGLEDVRSIVQREWSNQRRQEMIEQFYEKMVGRYQVDIQWPDAAMRSDAE